MGVYSCFYFFSFFSGLRSLSLSLSLSLSSFPSLPPSLSVLLSFLNIEELDALQLATQRQLYVRELHNKPCFIHLFVSWVIIILSRGSLTGECLNERKNWVQHRLASWHLLFELGFAFPFIRRASWPLSFLPEACGWGGTQASLSPFRLTGLAWD